MNRVLVIGATGSPHLPLKTTLFWDKIGIGPKDATIQRIAAALDECHPFR